MVRMRKLVCAFVVLMQQNHFSRQGPCEIGPRIPGVHRKCTNKLYQFIS